MIKHIVIVLGFSIIMQASAMETQPTIDDKKLCYLANMPVDVQNHILFFVKDDETEEEFIARIKNLKKDYKYGLCKKYNLCDKYNLHEYSDISFCLDESKFVFWNECFPLTLVTREEDKIWSKEIDSDQNRFILKLALSRHANIIAKFDESIYQDVMGKTYRYVSMHNIITQKKWKFEPPIYDFNDIDAFEFNKQGTHLIIQGSDIICEAHGPQLPHVIMSISIEKKKIDTLLNIEDFNQKSPFQQYLIERRVCKSLEYNNK